MDPQSTPRSTPQPSLATNSAHASQQPSPPEPHQSTAKYWIVLFASAVLEAVWATSLSQSQGFTILLPTIIFFVTTTVSLVGLGYAMKAIPISVAYAVWTGLGAALTAAIAFAMGTETVSVLKVLFLVGIVGCVVGLKFAPAPKPLLERMSSRAAEEN